MYLNRYEKQLIEILEKHPKINTRKFIKLANLGKTTFYKYTKSLEKEGYISYEQIKNQKEWYLMKKKKNQDWGMTSFEVMNKTMDDRYAEIESKVLAAIKKAKPGQTNDKVIGFGNSILLLLSTLSLFKLIYYYRKKRVPDVNVKFEKRIEQLLQKITDEKFNPEFAYGRISIDMVIMDAEDRLNEFLGIKKPELTYV